MFPLSSQLCIASLTNCLQIEHTQWSSITITDAMFLKYNKFMVLSLYLALSASWELRKYYCITKKPHLISLSERYIYFWFHSCLPFLHCNYIYSKQHWFICRDVLELMSYSMCLCKLSNIVKCFKWQILCRHAILFLFQGNEKLLVYLMTNNYVVDFCNYLFCLIVCTR